MGNSEDLYFRLVVLESPYAAKLKYEQWLSVNDRKPSEQAVEDYRKYFMEEVEDNLKFARQKFRELVAQGDAPIASHLTYTQDGILDDLVPNERRVGIAAGLAWRPMAEVSVFFPRDGYWSRGMLDALDSCVNEGLVAELGEGDAVPEGYEVVKVIRRKREPLLEKNPCK